MQGIGPCEYESQCVSPISISGLIEPVNDRESQIAPETVGNTIRKHVARASVEVRLRLVPSVIWKVVYTNSRNPQPLT